MSKFMELSLLFGYIPKVEFITIDDFIIQDEAASINWNENVYEGQTECKCVTLNTATDYVTGEELNEKEVA